MRRLTFGGCTGLIIAACAPQPLISVENAMAVCTEAARDAGRPADVSVGVGIGGGSHHGTHGGISIGLGNVLSSGRNPEVVYDQCVRKKSGVAPTKPLTL